jgi:hypothetical protein
MFSLISTMAPSRKSQSNDRANRTPRIVSIDPLEARRLHSVTPGGEVSSFSWDVTQTGSLKAGSSEIMMETLKTGTAQTQSIIAVLIAL